MNLINGLSSKLAALADTRRRALHRFVINDQEFLITSSRPSKEMPAEEICDFSAGGCQCYLIKLGECQAEPWIRDLPPPGKSPPSASVAPRTVHHEPQESPVPPITPMPSSLCSEVATLLTARELQIAALVAMGHSNKQMSRQLQISEWTVCSHLRRIFIKLGVDSRAAMVFRCANLLIQKTSDDLLS
jgi:DNA-binding CsgD family transcriptional regulator